MALAEKLLEKSRMLDELLPRPPRENLNTHFVLGEIIDQIDLIKDDFPLVQIATLKEHLWDIRNKNVDPEIHLRGFLHVFKNTEVFKDAFDQLDEGMKLRIKAFMDGKSEKEVLSAGGKTGEAFVLPPSPPVKHHFRKLVEDLKEDIHGLIHPEHKTKEGEIVQKLGADASTKGYPRIFEDSAETKTMEVSLVSFIV
tara:strand:- start:615 stop:1205 length:591 start_codon:yes stop_codon:yes gene_type:complete